MSSENIASASIGMCQFPAFQRPFAHRMLAVKMVEKSMPPSHTCEMTDAVFPVRASPNVKK